MPWKLHRSVYRFHPLDHFLPPLIYTSLGGFRINNLAAGTDAVNVSQLGSLSTTTSTGFRTTNTHVTSLLTSASTGLSTTTSGVASLSTGLNKVNDDLNNAARYFHADGLNDGNDDATATGSCTLAPESPLALAINGALKVYQS